MYIYIYTIFLDIYIYIYMNTIIWFFYKLPAPFCRAGGMCRQQVALQVVQTAQTYFVGSRCGNVRPKAEVVGPVFLE